MIEFCSKNGYGMFHFFLLLFTVHVQNDVQYYTVSMSLCLYTPPHMKPGITTVICHVCSVTDMLHTLGRRPLAYSRADAKLCIMYKIVNGLVGISSNQYLVPVNIINRR